jgi:hypothetical protein
MEVEHRVHHSGLVESDAWRHGHRSRERKLLRAHTPVPVPASGQVDQVHVVFHHKPIYYRSPQKVASSSCKKFQ